MTSFTLTQVREALQRLEVPAGATLLLHGSLLRLGRVDGIPLGENAAAIVEGILDYLGPGGTLAVPAFNFAFCKGALFDRWHTPSAKMGPIAEYVRLRPGSQRSRHPMQSVAAAGRLAHEICDDTPDTAFTPGSAFDRLLERDAFILLFGADFQAASLIHRAEELVTVPYRHYKEFCGECIDGDVREERCYRMYVRDLNINPKLILDSVGTELTGRRRLKTEPLGAGLLRLCTSQDLLDSAMAVLRRDPLSFISHGKVHATR